MENNRVKNKKSVLILILLGIFAVQTVNFYFTIPSSSAPDILHENIKQHKRSDKRY
jgi:hypothetical protein